MSENKTDSELILECLFEITEFVELDTPIQQRIIRTFPNFEDDFIITETDIKCRKCDNASLVNVSMHGAVKHYFDHRIDLLRKIGLVAKLPSKLGGVQ